MINPSELNLSTLPSVLLAERKQFPLFSCVYLAVDSLGQIQYVGQTTCLRARWTNHHRYEELQVIGGVSIAYIETPRSLLDAVESSLIEWFDPPLNRFRKESVEPDVKCHLQEYMNEAGLTQQGVAGSTGLSPTIVNRLYHNRFSRLDNQTVIKVCAFFKVSLGEMFSIEKDAQEQNND